MNQKQLLQIHQTLSFFSLIEKEKYMLQWKNTQQCPHGVILINIEDETNVK